MLSTLAELKKYYIFNYIFGIIFFGQILADYYDLEILTILLKPGTTISLMVGLYIYTQLKGRFHQRIFVGLMFSLFGDCFFLFQNSKSIFFIYALIAFFICHIFYTRAFYLDFRSAPELDKKGARITVVLGAVICTCFFFFLRPYLGSMRVPVLGYSLMITFMLMMAAFRNQRVNKSSFELILSGAILFYISDALIAINRFVISFNHASTAILVTYTFAQYLITMGAVNRILLNKS